MIDLSNDCRYFWRSKDLTFSLKPPKQGVKSVVRSDEDDFNRCWREYVAVLDMTQKLKPVRSLKNDAFSVEQ